MSEITNMKQDDITSTQVQAAANQMFCYLRDVLYDPQAAKLDAESLPEVFQDLGSGLVFIGESIIESRDLANNIAKGNLESGKISPDNELASGLKNLQATLKHITWQLGQVAKGDYQQKVRYAGEFSESINGMIIQLHERDKALREEIEINKKLAEDMQTNVAFFESMAANMTQWIVVFDKATKDILYSNRHAKDMLLDFSHYEKLRGYVEDQIDFERTPEQPFNTAIYFDPDVIAGVRPESNSEWIVELTGTDDNLNQYFSCVVYPLTWREKEALTFVFTDVSEEQREREELENVAYFDALTGTYSRHYGMQLLDKWLAAKEEFALSFVDMDSLKYVNDTFGHSDGDDYIMSTCSMLKGFDPKAKICRLGGDEFMLLCKGWNKAAADERLEYLRAELGKTSDDRYNRSISYGVVEVGRDNTKSGSLLLSDADEIMYGYKRFHKMQRRAELT